MAEPHDPLGSAEARPRSSWGPGKWIALILGGGCLLLALCCGGGLLLVKMSFGTIADSLGDELAGNAVLVEHLGPVRDVEVDWGRFLEAAQHDDIVFRVEGELRTGHVWIRLDSLEDGEMTEGELELPDGKRVDLFPQAPAEPVESLQGSVPAPVEEPAPAAPVPEDPPEHP